jgi:hypothetical protein
MKVAIAVQSFLGVLRDSVYWRLPINVRFRADRKTAVGPKQTVASTPKRTFIGLIAHFGLSLLSKTRGLRLVGRGLRPSTTASTQSRARAQ